MSSVITGKISSAGSVDPGVNVACNHSHHFLESESTGLSDNNKKSMLEDLV